MTGKLVFRFKYGNDVKVRKSMRRQNI